MFMHRAQNSVNASGHKRADRKIDDKKISGNCSESHRFVINLSVSRTLKIDAAAFWIAFGEKQSFTPQFITRP